MRALIAILVVCNLTGCAANQLTPEEVIRLDYGPDPIANYQEIVKAHLARVLVDPESARVTFISGPTKVYRKLAFKKDAISGWGVCVDMNAKNRMGGYTGAAPYHFIIYNGRVVSMVGSTDALSLEYKWAVDGCRATVPRQ